MNSTEKVLWILNRLGDEPYEMNLTSLANEMGTVKSGVYKILRVMTAQGFIRQNHQTKKYSIGPALFRLGNVYNNRVGIWGMAKPILMEIADVTKEEVSIGIREGDTAILAYKIDSPLPVRHVEDIGTKFPMNASSIGKVLAAYYDRDKVKSLLKSKTFEKLTENTLVDPDDILQEYHKIREQGYAIADGERFQDSFGLAVPIFINDVVPFCIAITGPKARISQDKIDNWITLLKTKADIIADLLTQSSKY